MIKRPILFSGSMVRAILEGRKTQTRRVVRPRPPYVMDERDDGSPWPYAATWSYGDDGSPWLPCPYGEREDQLWVRETHALMDPSMCPPEYRRVKTLDGYEAAIEYRADTDAVLPGEWPEDERGNPDCPRWRPSIHMPRWASRLTLRVTDVRVERVQNVAERECYREGITPRPPGGLGTIPAGIDLVMKTRARDDFRDLWDSINAKRGFGWATDPWVWVITFERIET